MSDLIFFLKGVNFKDSVNSFIDSTNIKHMLCARYYSKHQGYCSE